MASFNFSKVIPGTPTDMGPRYGKRDPYKLPMSFRDSGLGVGMGIVWVKGSHYSGCVEIPLNFGGIPSYKVCIICDVNNLGENLKEEIVFSVEYGFNPI